MTDMQHESVYEALREIRWSATCFKTHT